MRAFSRCAPRSFFFPFPGGVGSLLNELDLTETVGPRVTVKGKGDNVVLEFDVPRYKLTDINVTAKNGTLTVKGKNSATPSEDEHFLYGEAPFKSFNKSFSVPNIYDTDKLKTELEHGVLSVTIPKAAKPAEVPVNEKAVTTESSTTVPDLAKSYDELATMSWPPRVKVDDTATNLTYTVQLPKSTHADNINLKLTGRTLNVAVSHNKNVTKKDDEGNVIFSENQSVNFSTPLSVPKGTSPDEIATKLDNGVLTITVSKNAGTAQTVKVN